MSTYISTICGTSVSHIETKVETKGEISMNSNTLSTVENVNGIYEIPSELKKQWNGLLVEGAAGLKVKIKGKKGEERLVPDRALTNGRFILNFDPALKGKFEYEVMTCRVMVERNSLPWDKDTPLTDNSYGVITGPGYGNHRPLTDEDLTELRLYLSNNYDYEIGKKDALSIVRSEGILNRWNYFTKYIESLPSWDGKKRLGSLFHDYLGAEASELNEQIAVKMLVAVIARAFSDYPVKYDYMPILCGKQGIGKSLLLQRLAGVGLNDSINTFEGKTAEEQIQGKILAEVQEMEAFSKSSINRIKQFLTKNIDNYRKPYAVNANDFLRRTVFVGTTNDAHCLTDTSGNRRFLPVDCNVTEKLFNVYEDLTAEVVDAIWAEAYDCYKNGESLLIDESFWESLYTAQEEHRQKNPWEEIIEEYLDIAIPADWYDMTIEQQMSWMDHPCRTDETVKRSKVSIEEIWTVCLKQKRGDFGKNVAHSRTIASILNTLPGWNKQKVRYGKRVVTGAQRAL